MNRCLLYLFAATALILCSTCQSFAATIDFEGLADSTPITNQYSSLGMTFSGTTILTSGESLNEFEFPPSSGSNVVFDDSGPITINFSTPVSQVSGYFTYFSLVALKAYDSANSIVATSASSFSSNLALSGDSGSSPNEFLQLIYLQGFSKIVLEGDPLGSSFTMDDLTVTANAVPLPASFLLLGSGIVVLSAWRLRKD